MVVGVSFDDLVCDWRSLLGCCFRVAQKTSLPDSALCQGDFELFTRNLRLTREGFELYASELLQLLNLPNDALLPVRSECLHSNDPSRRQTGDEQRDSKKADSRERRWQQSEDSSNDKHHSPTIEQNTRMETTPSFPTTSMDALTSMDTLDVRGSMDLKKTQEDLKSKIADDAFALFEHAWLTCKPRTMALEWLDAQEPNRIILFAKSAQRAKGLWSTWMNFVRQGNFDTLQHVEIRDESEVGDFELEELITNLWRPSVECEVKTQDRLADRTFKERAPGDGRVHPREKTYLNASLSVAAWGHHIPVQNCECVVEKVVRGFGRGSTQLGIPTANMDVSLAFSIVPDLHRLIFKIPGVYAGWCYVNVPETQGQILGCVVNVGFSPFYNNDKATLEVYVFHEFANKFYGEEMGLHINRFLRAEGNDGYVFAEELVDSIQTDCQSCCGLLSRGKGFGSPSQALIDYVDGMMSGNA